MKPVKLASTLMALVLTTGCWDRTELNELSITSATSVDRVTCWVTALTAADSSSAALAMVCTFPVVSFAAWLTTSTWVRLCCAIAARLPACD